MVIFDLREYLLKTVFLRMKVGRGIDSSDALTYFDKLILLFERADWFILVWLFLVNVIFPKSQNIKNSIFLLLLTVAICNFFYFGWLYPRLRHRDYRFYPLILAMSFFIWIYYYLNGSPDPHLTVPYFLMLVSSALTLRRADTILALVSACFFIFFDEIIINFPVGLAGIVQTGSQITALIIFSGIVDLLTGWTKEKVLESQSAKKGFGEESMKTSILKRFASELVIDHQKAQLLFDTAAGPLLLVDNKMKIIDSNPVFEKMVDFKKDQLLGRTLSFVVTLEEPLNTAKQTFLPEKFKGTLLTRRGKVVTKDGDFHFLLSRNQRLEQILLSFSS